ncbi:nucleoside deaminase [Pelagovum pacificum]|uniref:Nucleoside deaminase n=1 Tax=Pelagovum pacificum TaxID=2588711 RepID=A0A5C5G888_9RHOB|nr:nucleoside deaminase [Pelagovum pacificum]QQA41627.1 nucleoside deaminase [Pelagovum pacificum]TNY30906.1 nucleoside deaminase [Pelagovum pacificum]
MTDADFIDGAVAQAMRGAEEGGVPVGATLRHGDRLVSEGRNRRQQEGTIILHGETDCLRQAGLYGAWSETEMCTTLSPCMMCAGTLVQFRVPRLVILDDVNFGGNEQFLRERGVEVEVRRHDRMISFFSEWKAAHPEIWNGDIGV